MSGAFARELGDGRAPDQDPAGRDLPHVVAWNLTERCNLECAHCYIAAGPFRPAAGELTTDECRRIVDEIVALNPSPFFILSGGEPLVRRDLEDIARHASERGATVVVGTNGVGLTSERIESLRGAGVTGVAVSIDSLDERYHDRFRHGEGALSDTVAAIDRLGEQELDFIVQTTLTRGNRDEIRRLVEWSAERGAVSFNLYFLVSTGRGEGMSGLSPDENEAVLAELVSLESEYRGRMMVRAKCQPALMRHAHAAGDKDSPLLRYGTRCPCGVQYCRILPDGKVTPCPYLPEVAGDLRTESFADVWWSSPVLQGLRSGELSGKCGRCEYRAVCGGCRARAFADSGDLLASDESCAHEPTGDAPVIEPVPAVTYGTVTERELEWDPAAEERMRRIPSFVRGVVVSRVEESARRQGIDRVTVELLDEMRKNMPLDFSKRLPFFARRKD